MKELRTIKVWNETRKRAKIIAAKWDCPMTLVFSKAIECLEEKQCINENSEKKKQPTGDLL